MEQSVSLPRKLIETLFLVSSSYMYVYPLTHVFFHSLTHGLVLITCWGNHDSVSVFVPGVATVWSIMGSSVRLAIH
jgi:hypothetical protein